MTNKEAIKILKDMMSDIFVPTSDDQDDALDLAIKALEERPTGEWIPVSERLPEESLNSVIGWDAYREKCVFVQYMDGHFQITGKPESFNIVAWKPMPEPYKEGRKNEQE